MVSTRSQTLARKIQGRRKSCAVPQPIIRQPGSAKIKQRRVTFSGRMSVLNEDATISTAPMPSTASDSPPQLAPKPKGRPKKVAAQNYTRVSTKVDVGITKLVNLSAQASVQLLPLDLTKLKFCKKFPNTVILNDTCCCIPVENNLPTINLCRSCTSNFDSLFAETRKEHIGSYEDVLKIETKKNEAVAKELKAVSDAWDEEKLQFINTTNLLDDLHDEFAQLVETSHGLKMQTDMFCLKIVMHDHNYA